MCVFMPGRQGERAVKLFFEIITGWIAFDLALLGLLVWRTIPHATFRESCARLGVPHQANAALIPLASYARQRNRRHRAHS
jgi:hypothetical protein